MTSLRYMLCLTTAILSTLASAAAVDSRPARQDAKREVGPLCVEERLSNNKRTTYYVSTSTSVCVGSKTYEWNPASYRQTCATSTKAITVTTTASAAVVPAVTSVITVSGEVITITGFNITETVTATSTEDITETVTSTQPASTLTETDTTTATSTISSTVTYTPPPSPSPSISCDADGFLVQSALLFRVNIATGQLTQITDSLADHGMVNALGYNILDNFLYGYDNISNQILRIYADGTYDYIIKLTAAASNRIIGDIDTEGQYWIATHEGDWLKIDLAPNSATYLETVASGSASPGDLTSVADWCYVPAAGDYLWTLARMNDNTNNVKLMRFGRTSHQWEQVALFSNSTNYLGGGNFGGLYGMNNGTGNMYAVENNGGIIYHVPFDGTVPYEVAQAPSTANNDGARCIFNILQQSYPTTPKQEILGPLPRPKPASGPQNVPGLGRGPVPSSKES